jgi:hypothetical protein
MSIGLHEGPAQSGHMRVLVQADLRHQAGRQVSGGKTILTKPGGSAWLHNLVRLSGI